MYTLIARIDFTDKYDKTVKYQAGKELIVDEERALELLSSETPVVRYIKREETLNIEKIKEENANLINDNSLLSTTINDLNEKIKTLESENKELKSKKKSENKETDKTE